MTAPKIESYQFGNIVIDGQGHDKDVIILPDQVLGGWWRQEGHVLHPGDLEAVLEAAPDVLVVGQGAHGRMQVTDETRRTLREAGIKLIAQSSSEAWQTYNDLQDKKETAAALHLTC